MSRTFSRRLAPASVKTRSLPWREFFKGVSDVLRISRNRQQQRRELLEYIANDHRAASDMGITSYEARKWSEQPFWRP